MSAAAYYRNSGVIDSMACPRCDAPPGVRCWDLRYRLHEVLDIHLDQGRHHMARINLARITITDLFHLINQTRTTP